MSSGCYSLLYNNVLVGDGKNNFQLLKALQHFSLSIARAIGCCDSLLLWKDIRHPLVFINFLGRLRPVVAYT